jgi:ribosomal subunit interface protein
MKLVITGKNLDMGESLRSRIEERIATGVERLFDGSVKSQVVIEKQRGFFHCECTLNLPTGLTLQAHGRGADAHTGFDEAASHLEHQLKRYKKRLRDHQQSRTEPVKAFTAASYVIAGSREEAPGTDSLSPTIIAETTADIPELTVGEAVLQLEISDLPFVLFRNRADAGFNLVYRRHDGHIGWIDPGRAG